MAKPYYLNPVTYAALASQVLEDTDGSPRGAELRRFNRYARQGIEASLILALGVNIDVNPFHMNLTDAERQELYAKGF